MWQNFDKSFKSKIEFYLYILYQFLESEIYSFSTFNVAFEDTSLFTNLCVIPIYLIDIILRFFTMHWKDMYLINNPKTIAIRYLKFKFWIDLIPTLPFFLLHPSLLFLKLVRIIKFNDYLNNIMEIQEKIFGKWGGSKKSIIIIIQKTTQFFSYLAYACHFFGWMWILLGRIQGNSGWVIKSTVQLQNPYSTFDIYVGGLYTIVTMFATVGYGDFKWGTSPELIFQMVAELSGIVIFGYIFKNMSNIATKVDSVVTLKELSLEEINVWLIKLSKSNKEKLMNHDYYLFISKFYNDMWDKDYNSIK